MQGSEVVYLTVLVPYTINKSILNPSRADTDIKLSNSFVNVVQQIYACGQMVSYILDILSQICFQAFAQWVVYCNHRWGKKDILLNYVKSLNHSNPSIECRVRVVECDVLVMRENLQRTIHRAMETSILLQDAHSKLQARDRATQHHREVLKVMESLKEEVKSVKEENKCLQTSSEQHKN